MSDADLVSDMMWQAALAAEIDQQLNAALALDSTKKRRQALIDIIKKYDLGMPVTKAPYQVYPYFNVINKKIAKKYTDEKKLEAGARFTYAREPRSFSGTIDRVDEEGFVFLKTSRQGIHPRYITVVK